MTPKQSQVEINGRIYDAKTGELISVTHSKTSVVKRRKVIDGFTRPHSSGQVHNSSVMPKKPHVQAPMAKKMHAPVQKTKRLHPSLSGMHKSTSDIKRHKPSRAELITRQQKAQEVERSKLINRHRAKLERFSMEDEKTVVERITAPLPFISKKVANTIEKPEPMPAEDEAPDEHKDFSWFRRHLVPAAASFSALVLMGGFLIYNSLPSLTMRVAASRAGFNASVPSYQPSGFTFDGPVSYGPGRVVIKFNSNTDDRAYTITENESAWDSKSLLENFVSSEAENYLTFEEHGLTVYLFNDSQATWVDEGVWYTVEGSADLSSEQLLKIAASL